MACPRCVIAVAVTLAAAPAGSAAQASVADMLAGCRFEAAVRLGGDAGSIAAAYAGPQADGTEAVTGTIRQDGAAVAFRCAYDRGGTRLVGFTSDAAADAAQATTAPETHSGTPTERVRFRVGGSGAHLSGSLGPGGSVRYLVRASAGQHLSVALVSGGPYLYFNVYGAGGTLLYASEKGRSQFRGRLDRTGDQVVEVYYAGAQGSGYRFSVGLD